MTASNWTCFNLERHNKLSGCCVLRCFPCPLRSNGNGQASILIWIRCYLMMCYFFVDKINTFCVIKKERISLFVKHGKFNLEPKHCYYWENVIEFPRKEMKKTAPNTNYLTMIENALELKMKWKLCVKNCNHQLFNYSLRIVLLCIALRCIEHVPNRIPNS